MSDYFD